jgi:hypothetical protein
MLSPLTYTKPAWGSYHLPSLPESRIQREARTGIVMTPSRIRISNALFKASAPDAAIPGQRQGDGPRCGTPLHGLCAISSTNRRLSVHTLDIPVHLEQGIIGHAHSATRTQIDCEMCHREPPGLYAPSGCGAIPCRGDGGRLNTSCGNISTR